MDIYALLIERFPHLVLERDFSFSRHTTIGCGGSASVCAYPQNVDELAALLGYLAEQRIAYCFLGVGANVLPQDGLYEGVVIRFSRMNALTCFGTAMTVGAGITGGALLRFARAHNIGGFEFLTGIPMTVGGAIVMNAGVQEGHIGDRVERVIGVEKGKIRIFTASECGFGTKTSIFQSGIAVAGAVLKGVPRAEAEILRETARFRARRSHLPLGRSMGCTFVNPSGQSAGEIIDRCGLKGFSVGGARISEVHANFIMNDGASSAEIAQLIALIKEEVFRKTGILLKEEIKRIP